MQVRAANLQELVYKQGSAGITKATVSIVFHNNDPANGPSGYEDKEYITVTRQVSSCWHRSSRSRGSSSVKNSSIAAVCMLARSLLQH
jgi:chromosome segregation ATPase